MLLICCDVEDRLVRKIARADREIVLVRDDRRVECEEGSTRKDNGVVAKECGGRMS